MKKFLLGTVGLLALGMGAPASAADMAVKARPPAPVLAPIYDWTGFYIGGNGGWGDLPGLAQHPTGSRMMLFRQAFRDVARLVIGSAGSRRPNRRCGGSPSSSHSRHRR